MRLPSLPSKASKAISFFCALDNWLSLSRNRPLKFYLQSSSSNSSHIDRYLTILGAHIHRWQDIHFDLPSYSSFPRVSSTKFPFLERLVLNTSGTAGAEAFIVALRSVERLQTLAIHSPWHDGFEKLLFSRSIEAFALRCWTGYPTLNLSRLAVDMAHCHNLVSLQLCLGHLHFQELENTSRYVLPKLETLSLNIHDLDMLAVFIRVLELPRLESLELFTALEMGSGSELIGPNLIVLLSSCTGSISVLSFHAIQMPPDDLRNVLAVAKNIQSLTLTSMASTYDILNHLAFRFSPTGQLIWGQNTNLSDLTVIPDWEPDSRQSWDEDEDHENSNVGFYRQYCKQLVDVVESRRAIPDDAHCSDGEDIAELGTIGIDLEFWRTAEKLGAIEYSRMEGWQDTMNLMPYEKYPDRTHDIFNDLSESVGVPIRIPIFCLRLLIRQFF